MAGATDYYADLGLTKDATSAEITKAFRKLALTCHPDRGGDQEQFTRINKAHEVLSDAKARARYDNTGRTTALTPEEEFRESFFAGAGGLFGGGETKRTTGGGPRGATEAEKEEARRRESERQEAQRRLDEADRRDAERRARLNGGGAAAAPPPQAPAAAAAPPPSAGVALSVGMRVKLHSLSSRPELNGLTGVLVAQVQDKWQVRLDGDGGEKLLKAKNLAPNMVAPSPAPTPKPANSTMPAAQPSHSPASQGYPNGAAAPSSTANRGEQLCAHPKCNHLVHSDPKLSKTHCCKVCQGTQTHMAPTHGPACERRVAPRNSVRAEPPAAGARPAAKPQPPTGLPSEQPTHRYQIITDFAFVRQDRLHNAPVYGKKQRGDVVTGAEETFDGWVHLADEPGWIIKDMQGRQNVGKVLMPLGGEPTLAVPTPLASPGPVTFKVVFKPQIAIRGGPNKQAQIMGMKKAGESIVAEVQTYGGWVRLQGGNTWALTNDATFGKLLESEQVQTAQAQSQAADQNSSLAALDQAVKSRDASQIQQALARARAAGADKARTQAAEQTLAELKADVARLDGKKRDLRQRIDKAKDNERELRDCIDDGARDGFKEETMLAQRMLNELQEARSKTQQKHHGLLERLAAAAASGDKQEMKAARDAAQKGGVDKKEIARIFSLNIINAAEKPTQVPTDAQLPSVDRGPSAAAQAQPTPEAPRAEPGALEIALGVRVQLHSLQNRTELNGVTGILVAQREKGWQVLLFNGAGMKLFKEKNLTPYDKYEGPPTQPPTQSVSAPSAPLPAREEPAPAPAAEAPADESWTCAECDFRNLKGGSTCEACDEPRKTSAPSAESAGPEPAGFAGRWIGQDGEWMGTIEGSSIQWADGPLVELTFLSERSFSCEMSAEGVTETFSAELDGEGRLVWCDGDIWTRTDH